MPIRILLVAVFTACAPITHAAELRGSLGFVQLCERLPAATKQRLAEAAKEYLPILESRSHLNLNAIKVARFADIDPVLARAVRQGMGTLEVFTQAELGRLGSCALLLDRETLAAIDAKYALHGVWQLAAPAAHGTLEDFRMDYLIVGQGHLVIGYPGEAEVPVEDDSGEQRHYRYEPYICADIINAGPTRGLFDVMTLASPNGKFRPFEGPFGAEIHSFQMVGNAVLVKYTWGVDQDRRARKAPIAFKASNIAQK